MEFKETATLYIEKNVKDQYGGYTKTQEKLCDIKVVTAPYRVEIGARYEVPNPFSSIKFFTNSKLNFDEDTFFYIVYKGKKYKKVTIANYGKVIMIVGERVEY